jgi:hypothetical protein
VQEYVVPLVAHLLEDGHVLPSMLDSVPLLAGPEMGESIKSQVSALIKLPLPITTIKTQVRPLYALSLAKHGVHERQRRYGTCRRIASSATFATVAH